MPLKVGMALTAHKTVAMFMRYVHTEDDPCGRRPNWWRPRRKSVIGMHQEPKEVTTSPVASGQPCRPQIVVSLSRQSAQLTLPARASRGSGKVYPFRV